MIRLRLDVEKLRKKIIKNIHIDEEVNLNEYLLDYSQKSKGLGSAGFSIFLGISFEYAIILPFRGMLIHNNYDDRRRNLLRNPSIGIEFGYATSSAIWSGGESDISDFSNYLFKGFVINAFIKI